MAVIYIRTDGNDDTGDGTLALPFATAQKGFEVAYVGAGDYILDFGVGSFGGVNLTTASATSWPIRISMRGVSSATSLLGGVNGDATSFDGEGNPIVISPITITSDLSINLGNVSCNGLSAGEYPNGSSGGTISLTNCVTGSISCVGGSGGDYNAGLQGGNGGSLTLVNCDTGLVSADAGNFVNFASGGGVNATDSSLGDISANSYDGADSTHGGSVTLLRSTCTGISASQAGTALYTAGPTIGGGGAVTLTDSSCTGNIDANGGVSISESASIPVGGIIVLNSSNSGNLSVAGGYNSYYGYYNPPNLITLNSTQFSDIGTYNASKLILIGSIAIPSLDFDVKFNLVNWVAPSGGGSDGIDLARLLGLPAFVRL